ncbi:molecular chaperone [Morganella morganii]|uniref:Molecular chaperone n=1 Tax=Morganella morganii TaxID=582 RepID=A0A433ZZ31_MORMO|nr:fimbria/pilus periplasmic chaperone [Morganella morganii]RUT67400.1 molecular chaperone [Morganella morganii]
MRKIIFSFIVVLLFPAMASAGGIALGATRIIYPMEEKQVSLAVTNTDEKNRFLIQSWIDDASDKKTKLFTVTPPLFVSKPKSENTIKIINTGANLPKDRESLFWLNSKAIPSVEREQIADKNVLQIAVLARIKMFVRPEGLPVKVGDAYKMLKFNKVSGGLNVTNPSPYYLTVINMTVADQKIDGFMIAPFAEKIINTTKPVAGKISYQTINDYGANTPVISVNSN